MSRSYKKNAAGSWACGEDKWARTQYHRCERRQTKGLLKEQIKYGTSTWKPIDEVCGLYGDVCNIDDWWVKNPSEYIINYSECSKPYCDNSNCFSCHFQYWNKDYNFLEEPADRIITNNINYTVRCSDKWTWPSDGGTYWRTDLSEMRKQFDKDVFSTLDTYRKTNIWENYVAFRNKVNNKKHRKYVISFLYKNKIGTQTRYETNFDSNGKGVRVFKKEPIYEEVYKKIIVNKHPSKLHFEYDGWYNTYFHKQGIFNEYYYSDLMRFLFKQNKIPLTFWGKKDLLDWLRAHEEEIISSWLKYEYLRK